MPNWDPGVHLEVFAPHFLSPKPCHPEEEKCHPGVWGDWGDRDPATAGWQLPCRMGKAWPVKRGRWWQVDVTIKNHKEAIKALTRGLGSCICVLWGVFKFSLFVFMCLPTILSKIRENFCHFKCPTDFPNKHPLPCSDFKTGVRLKDYVNGVRIGPGSLFSHPWDGPAPSGLHPLAPRRRSHDLTSAVM